MEERIEGARIPAPIRSTNARSDSYNPGTSCAPAIHDSSLVVANDAINLTIGLSALPSSNRGFVIELEAPGIF